MRKVVIGALASGVLLVTGGLRAADHYETRHLYCSLARVGHEGPD